jgi:Fe-S-cluster containining protein
MFNHGLIVGDYKLQSATLHIPEGIRFECSSCGNCCLTWPVPATDRDVAVISAKAAENSDLAKLGSPLFKGLSTGTATMRGFSHTLEKRPDGRCQFLTEENLCLLHSTFGPDAKPSMCRLFPYSFVTAPSGAYVYVSFASTAVLFNAGRLLSEQRELLTDRYTLFQELFPQETDWSGIQLLDGCPLSWSQFLAVEEQLFTAFAFGKGSLSALNRLIKAGQAVQEQLPASVDPEKMPALETGQKTVDQLIIKHLSEFYFPENLFEGSAVDFEARALMKELVSAPPTVSLSSAGNKFRFQQIIEQRLGDLDERSEELLTRFAYCRLFAKLYFGPGFAFLSMLAGVHHLGLLIALIRIQAKLMALAGQQLSFESFAEILRRLERRLSQLNFSKESVSALEVLLRSPSRLERIAYIAR